jgi:hypothetical protein
LNRAGHHSVAQGKIAAGRSGESCSQEAIGTPILADYLEEASSQFAKILRGFRRAPLNHSHAQDLPSLELLMEKIKIGTGDWIVVCDGRKALILENIGDRMFPNLHTREVHEHPDPPTSAQGSSPPGKVH